LYNLVLKTVSLEALTAILSSICIAKLLGSSINKNNHTHFVNIGLANGVLLHTFLDSVNGQLTNTTRKSASWPFQPSLPETPPAIEPITLGPCTDLSPANLRSTSN
ncbi:hypothetical protein PCANC_19029, partial [Puccinia coronata f. sp. avenae]